MFLVVLIAIGIPLVLFILKGPPSTSPTKPKSEFSLVESSPSDQQNATPVIAQPTFVFSKKIGISEKELGKYFTMTPKTEGSWHIEKNGQVVYFASNKKGGNKFPQTFEYQTSYSVTIDKSFHSENGKQLGEEAHVTFKTQQNPEFGLTSYKSLLPALVGESIDIEVGDYSGYEGKYAQSIKQQMTEPYKVTLQKATKEELLSYFKYKKNSYLAINEVPDELVHRESVTATGQYMALGQGGYTKAIHVSSPVFKTPGIYFVTFSNKYGRDRLFVVVSKHVAQVLHDNKKSYVVTTASDTNKAIGGIKVEYYNALEKVSLLDTKSTNPEGIAQQNKFSDDTDFVVTSQGEDIAITSTRGYRMGIASDGESEVFSYTDRPIYRPGDTVHYKAVIRVRDDNGNYAIKQKNYYVKYVAGFDTAKGEYKEVTTDENGTLTFDTKVPYSETNQYPNIYLASKNAKGEYQSMDTLPILVEAYKKPEMDISVKASEKEYISGDTSHMTVIGKTNYGKPLSGIKFTYRVMLVDYTELKDRNDEQIEVDIYANYYGGGKELTSGASEFDKNGTANIEFSTKLPESFEQSQVALLEVTPTIGAVPSFGKIVRLIHRGEFALFFDGIEGNTTTGLSGYTQALNHNNPRQAVGNMKGKLTLTKKEYYSENGQVIETRDIELDGKGRVGFTFRNLKEGNYELKSEFTDQRGNKVTGVQMTYIGSPVQLTGPASAMAVSFDKQKYNDGQTARATVISNFLIDDVYIVTAENKGGMTRIVSVERRKGEGRTKSLTISVPVKKETGQAVEVLLYAVTKGEIAMGQGSFTVERKVEKLTTTVQFDKNRYKPGENVKVKITTKDKSGKGVSADNSLSIIDAALLQLGKLRTGIAEHFNTIDTYIAISHYDSLTGIYADGPGGGGGCFLEGTQILMGDGTTKKIEDVRKGDSILTRKSDTSKEMVKNTVDMTFAHTVTEYLLINNRVKVTPVHRLFLNGKWAEASSAKIGDTLLDASGYSVEITSIIKHIGNFRVYNLTTNPSHTFFADGIYVHNEKGLDARQNFVDTLYWNPHIRTDGNGEATVSFKLADNVTTFTAQAFSNTKDSLFGEGAASIVSYKDLTIIPSLAAFYYEHDKPVISMVTQNSTGNDMDLTIVSGIKELSGENKQDIHVKGNDLEVVQVPFDLENLKKNATFIVEARDRGGKVVDSVLVKKPVLPQGNIIASWESFENSYDHVFQPEFPTLDANRMAISVVPDAAAAFFQPYHYFSASLSNNSGKELYAYAYILARTRDGFIDPSSYGYAKDKNDFRQTIQTLIDARGDMVWNQPPNGYGKDSFEASNLWVAMGFEQAAKYHMIDEITNALTMANETKEFFKGNREPQKPSFPPFDKSQFPQGFPPPGPIEPQSPTPTMYPTPFESLTPTPSTTSSGIIVPPPFQPTVTPPPYSQPVPFPNSWFYTDDEKLARSLVYGDSYHNDGSGFEETPEGIAAQILTGNSKDVQKLINGAVPTASDRYIWDGYSVDSPGMPVLALVEKGSLEEAKKAIRGISFTGNRTDPLVLYAALRYAEKSNIKVAKVVYKVIVNGEKVFEFPEKNNVSGNGYPTFSQVFSTRNSKDGKLHLEFKSEGDMPIYGTVSEFLYGSSESTRKKGNYKNIDLHLARSYRDNETGQSVGAIETGKTGVVVLSADATRLMRGNQATGAYSFLAEDALSPNVMYLEQYDEYYNPQFQSVLKKLFPSSGYQDSYSLPENYSDQAVFYSGSGNIGNKGNILPYVVFNASDGTYFRPKTSIIYPVLGIITDEK